MNSNSRNVSMDFFRGLMAVIVAIGHFLFWNGKTQIIPLSFVLAVDFFLVLSGFVLTGSVISKKSMCSFTFAKKRYLRIAPVFFFASAVTVPIAIHLLSLPLPYLSDIFRIVTISGIFPMNARSPFIYAEPLGIAWTISAELWIGIIFFPLVYFLKKSAEPLLFPVLISFVVICFLVINIDSPDFMNILYQEYYGFITYGLIRTLMDYSLGAIAFLYKDKLLSFKLSIMNSVVQVLILLVLVYLYCKIGYNRNNEIFAPIFFMLLIISLSKNNGVLYKLFSGRLGIFMGDISYPSYMMHPLLIIIFVHVINFKITPLCIILYVLSLLIISKIVNSFIEKPCLKLIQKAI